MGAYRAANAVDIDQHIVRGTFRRDRHGLRATEPAALGTTERRQLLAGLGEAGRRFVRAALDQFGDWTPADLLVLRQVAAASDRIFALEAVISEDGMITTGRRGARKEHPLASRLRAETRTLTNLLKALRLER